MAIDVWADKYRPETLDEYVWRDPQMRKKVEEWVDAGIVPQHLMLTGGAGTGKTSLALLLMRQLKIPPQDFMRKNASSTDESGIAALEHDIKSFAEGFAFGPTDTKYILLDEADNLSKRAQGFLRAEVEKSQNQTRFIFTANYPGRIDPAIHSRCFEIKFKVLQRDEFLVRAATILSNEKIECDLDILEAHVDATYPDMRKCINSMQGKVISGVLQPMEITEGGMADYMIDSIEMFKKKKYNEARKIIIAQAPPDEYPDIYRILYQNLDLFSKNPEKQTDILLIIRNALVNHSHIADQEINLSAALAEITRASC